MSKWLVISRYKEPNMGWVYQRVNPQEWNVFIDEKGYDEQLNFPGRDCYTWLRWIVDHYDSCERDEYVFAQADPFPHDNDFLAHMNDSAYNYFGPVEVCEPNGLPHADFLGDLHSWCEVFWLPKLPHYRFVAGCQYRVHGHNILDRDKHYWEALLAITKTGHWRTNKSAWILERLWPLIFGIEV